MYNRLTENDVKRIQEEIDHRKVEVRKELIEAVKEARAQGDLSENFEYYAAKRAKNQNESRIQYLEKMLKTAEIVEEGSDADVVGMNNRVELYFEEEDTEEVYKIVTPVRADSLNNKISIESPIGKAIFGRKVGERVMVSVGESWSFPVEIKWIDQTSTDEDDEIRKF